MWTLKSFQKRMETETKVRPPKKLKLEPRMETEPEFSSTTFAVFTVDFVKTYEEPVFEQSVFMKRAEETWESMSDTEKRVYEDKEMKLRDFLHKVVDEKIAEDKLSEDDEEIADEEIEEIADEDELSDSFVVPEFSSTTFAVFTVDFVKTYDEPVFEQSVFMKKAEETWESMSDTEKRVYEDKEMKLRAFLRKVVDEKIAEDKLSAEAATTGPPMED